MMMMMLLPVGTQIRQVNEVDRPLDKSGGEREREDEGVVML
jgi:hypothetical protein